MAWLNMNGVIGPDSIDPDSGISDLPFAVLLSLSEYLNVGDNKMNWRAVIAQIPERIYSDDEVESIALSIHEYNGSPALKLLRNLGSKGRSVRQLISYLERLGHEKCLMLIKKPEIIRLLQVPISQTVQSGPGTVVVFACKAKGFPFPHYRWYQAFGLDSYGPHNSKQDKKRVSYEEVAGATDRVLKISPVRQSHSGAYCCQVYHKINNKIEQVFTDWAYLRVYPPAKEDEFLELDVDHQLMQKPKIFQQPPVALSVRPGKPIIVVCHATGCPPPKYQWYKFGYLTQSNPLEPHALRDQQKESLYWAESTADDKGMYQCRVWNEAGCETSKTVTITVDSRLPESYPDTIMIQHQPESVSSRIGEQRFLSCRADVTEGNLFFQWYLNSQEIPGATQSELHFLPVKPEDRGMYQCRIQNEHVCVWSNQAMLEIIGGVEQPKSEFKYFATDKVALLIGNQDYRSDKRLVSPEFDVEKLAIVLSELDFKVISLLNLNLHEMNFALNAFCDLLNNGVYGLFYFSGHGFANDGQSYMIPVDAAVGYSTHECVCDQYVLDQMQYRNTALNVILLDICRKNNTYPQEAAKRYTPDVKGNTVFGYAAQTNTQAWEAEKKPYAFFTKHLIQRIKQNKRVSHMLEDVIQDVCSDPDLCDKQQYPAITQTLRESRTLLDPINPEGHTEEINSRSRLWGSAHLLPEMPIWMEFQYGVCVCIDIKTRFSNVLVIYSYIPVTGNATNCTVKLENFTSELDIKMENQDHEGMPNPDIQITKTTVRNLQRLQGDMESTVTVQGEYQGERFQQKDTLVVTKPLVSKLWQTQLCEKRYAIPSERSFLDD